MVLGGISLVTTAPIHTTLLFPIVHPLPITDLAPIIAPSPIFTPSSLLLGGYLSLVSTAPGPMKTSFPIFDKGAIYANPAIRVFAPITVL